MLLSSIIRADIPDTALCYVRDQTRGGPSAHIGGSVSSHAANHAEPPFVSTSALTLRPTQSATFAPTSGRAFNAHVEPDIRGVVSTVAAREIRPAFSTMLTPTLRERFAEAGGDRLREAAIANQCSREGRATTEPSAFTCSRRPSGYSRMTSVP